MEVYKNNIKSFSIRSFTSYFKNYEKGVLLRLSCVAKENSREYLYLYLESDEVHWCILKVKQMAVTNHMIYGWVNCEQLEWEDFMTLDDEFDEIV